MKSFYFTIALLFLTHIGAAQIVDIPDINFKNAILNHSPVIDTNGDDEIQVTEAHAFIGALSVANKSIVNLEGIQSFINIEELNASFNSLGQIDLSQNTNLIYLNVGFNQLVDLDLSQNNNLEILIIRANWLGDIDLSQNINLKEFTTGYNAFETVDVSNNINLELLTIVDTPQFTHIDLSNNINLGRVFFGDTQLSSLDVSNNPDLTLIQVINCPITNLDISQNPLIDRLLLNGSSIQNINTSNNPELQYLHLNETPITTIDFSQNPLMLSFKAYECPNLQFINARNGQNSSMSQFQVENSPNLDYICVDNIGYATINFDYSSNTVLTEDCENPNGDYNIIRGRLSFDFNENGCNPDDYPVPNMMVYSDDGTDEFASFTNENGEYAVVVGTGIYNTEAIEFLSLFDVDPLNSTQEYTDFGNTAFQNFCFTANQSVSNVSTYMCLTQDSRPGYETSYIINVPNYGSNLSNGTIEFQFDGDKQSFVSASQVPVSQTSNSLVFSYNDLVPLQKKQILITMMTFAPPIVNGGDVLNFTLTATPDVTDDFPENNVCVRSQVVVNSFDPNDKLVAQGEEVYIDDIDEYLIYTIRFQNTGTASAINVLVTDELNDNLDWSTLAPVDASHDYNAQVTGGNNLEILFENIDLPAQQDDDQGSSGYFIFKIKPKSDLVVGDIITGEAKIYFDFNAPIITDTISTEIVEEQLSISEFEKDMFLVFPNPANSKLTIQSKVGISEISIIDINGRRLKTIDNLDLSQDITLDIESLSNGIYFLNIQAENTEQVIRFAKN
ncbi:DUF7619 domain-containing protein [Psychroserpens mesophilus]|uniref:T9SS type A sorting domain-containing protein n=1 Tax=Psychroserpens mesophilus TaxID=325473 RepID=UPI003D6600AF